MQKVKVLGVVGSPRKNGNTAKLVKRALDDAMRRGSAFSRMILLILSPGTWKRTA